MGKKVKSGSKPKPKTQIQDEPKKEPSDNNSENRSCSVCKENLKVDSKSHIQCVECKKMAHFSCYPILQQ